MTDWTVRDSTAACAQGWDVFEVWDGFLQLDIHKVDSGGFLTNADAQEFVKVRASASSQRDPLCHKAWSLVFRSKIKTPFGKEEK